MNLLILLLKSGVFCFMFLWGAQIILRDNYVENYIYIIEPDEALEQKLRKTHTPFDGFIPTLISCMVPIFNILYVSYYLIIGLTNDEDKLYELREIMRELKNER